MSSSYIFAKNDLFLAYVNNYNHYVSYFKNTYQHGISLEEMIIPCSIQVIFFGEKKVNRLLVLTIELL
jgi:hypothetical protein